jgi:rRNA maturation RNase YbeY
MIRITLSDKRFNIDRRRLMSLIKTVMESESAENGHINIIYCADRLIKDLNTRYLNRNHVTDVLAFDLQNDREGDFLGEIYVNLQQAKRQSLEYDISYREEVERLTVHGVLHLLGYDDGNGASRRKMWKKQESYLNRWKK